MSAIIAAILSSVHLNLFTADDSAPFGVYRSSCSISSSSRLLPGRRSAKIDLLVCYVATRVVVCCWPCNERWVPLSTNEATGNEAFYDEAFYDPSHWSDGKCLITTWPFLCYGSCSLFNGSANEKPQRGLRSGLTGSVTRRVQRYTRRATGFPPVEMNVATFAEVWDSCKWKASGHVHAMHPWPSFYTRLRLVGNRVQWAAFTPAFTNKADPPQLIPFKTRKPSVPLTAIDVRPSMLTAWSFLNLNSCYTKCEEQDTLPSYSPRADLAVVLLYLNMKWCSRWNLSFVIHLSPFCLSPQNTNIACDCFSCSLLFVVCHRASNCRCRADTGETRLSRWASFHGSGKQVSGLLSPTQNQDLKPTQKLLW